jgi:hypothetical protein
MAITLPNYYRIVTDGERITVLAFNQCATEMDCRFVPVPGYATGVGWPLYGVLIWTTLTYIGTHLGTYLGRVVTASGTVETTTKRA